jgi:hypothetical protein
MNAAVHSGPAVIPDCRLIEGPHDQKPHLRWTGQAVAERHLTHPITLHRVAEVKTFVGEKAICESQPSFPGPTGAMAGRHSRAAASTDWQKQWASQIPGATIDTVQGPHFPQEERGPRIAELVLAYMRASV